MDNDMCKRRAGKGRGTRSVASGIGRRSMENPSTHVKDAMTILRCMDNLLSVVLVAACSAILPIGHGMGWVSNLIGLHFASVSVRAGFALTTAQ